MAGPPTLTREELFNLVWSKPVSHLGEEYAVSDVGLAKLCARHGIPTPPRGYWAQLAAGRAPAKPKLPPAADDSPIKLPPPRSKDAVVAIGEVPLVEEIHVADRLTAPHDLVARTRDALRDAKDGPNGMLTAPKGCVALHVSRQHLSRALRVADALLKACEALGWPVKAHDERTVVTVDGMPLTMAITETPDRVEAPPDTSTSYYTFQYNRTSYITRPSGHLTIRIDSLRHFWNAGVRRNWRGTDKHPVESCLSSVLRGMQKLAVAVRADNEATQRRELQEIERQREAERARQDHERRQRAIAEDKARVDGLLEQARRWKQSKDLRAFIEASQQRAGSGKLDLHGKDFGAWVEWATRHADRLDPFTSEPERPTGGAGPPGPG